MTLPSRGHVPLSWQAIHALGEGRHSFYSEGFLLHIVMEGCTARLEEDFHSKAVGMFALPGGARIGSRLTGSRR